MAYSLDDFVGDCRRILSAEPGLAGRERVRALSEKLVKDEAFVAAHLGPQVPKGKRTLYEDPELGFVVLGYVMDEPRKSSPHDHGRSWAIYAQVSAHTDMTEYRRLGGGEGAGAAELAVDRAYRLNPGQAGLYDGAQIHAIDYPAGARFVRVTGCDLDHAPRIRYDEAAKQAVVIESATAG